LLAGALRIEADALRQREGALGARGLAAAPFCLLALDALQEVGQAPLGDQPLAPQLENL
jgi:hypothetical protein